MATFSYSEFLEASQGLALTLEQPFAPTRVWTDTRTLQPGDFFLPLSGERFDGHDYLPEAFRTGAIGAFVSRDRAQAHPEWRNYPNLIAVSDPLAAYLAIARRHRQTINPLTIAVTGSSGKTTTKDMLYAAFSRLRKTIRTEKNFNNEIGVSQTLLSIQPDTEVLIVEMGMRGLGEIAMLSCAAKPDAAIVVNVGPAHIGRLGSLENIARAKLEIAEGMDPVHGALIVNGDDRLLSGLAPTVWHGRLERYILEDAQDIQSWTDGVTEGVRFFYHGAEVRLSVPGEHMVSNALGVLRLGEALGFTPAELAEGLSAFSPEKGRWERFSLEGYPGVQVINDAYNANPDSVKASLRTFLSASRPERRSILVLGGMKELGDFSHDYHRELGAWLGEQSTIAALFTVGEEGGWIADAACPHAGFPVIATQDATEAADRIVGAGGLLENAVIYLKGSRAYNLDAIPPALTRHALMKAGDAPSCP